MEALTIMFSVLGVVSIPAGYVVTYVSNLGKRQTATETRLAAHEAADTTALQGIHTSLTDLKAGQLRGEGKIDQLVYRLIPAPKA